MWRAWETEGGFGASERLAVARFGRCRNFDSTTPQSLTRPCFFVRIFRRRSNGPRPVCFLVACLPGEGWLRSQWLRVRAMRLARLTHGQLATEVARLDQRRPDEMRGARGGDGARGAARRGDPIGGAGPPTGALEGAFAGAPIGDASSGDAPAAPAQAALAPVAGSAAEAALVCGAFCAGYFGSAARRAGAGVFAPLPRLAALAQPAPTGAAARSLGSATLFV